MTPFERRLLWSSTIVVGLSGLAFLWLKYFVVPDDPFAIVNHPWQPFVLKVHVVSAPFLVFAVGAVFLRHVWRQFRSGRPEGRHTGVVLMLVLAPMVLSGYLLQAVTSRPALRTVAWVHIGTGVLYLAAMGAHQLRATAAQRAAPGESRSVDA